MKIAIENLAVRYGDKRVIDSLSLAIEPGTFFTLLGPSGCGKTTLLRAIAGFVPVEEGRLLFGDKDVARLPAHKRNIGIVFQDYALFPDKTVDDNVAYGLRARRVPEAVVTQEVGKMLERVGLSGFGSRLPAALSGGQRQRVALARALVISPDVLLMDEPLSNLDAKLRHAVRESIVELQRESGITTVFVTHDQDEALAMSDRIGVMNAGRLEQIGSPTDIYRSPRTAYVADFIGAANILPVTLVGAAAVGDSVTVEVAGHAVGGRAGQALAAGPVRLVIRPEDIRIGRAAGSDGGNRAGIPARLARRQYLGAKTIYAALLPDGAVVTIECSGDGHDGFATGSDVQLMLAPDKTLVLPS